MRRTELTAGALLFIVALSIVPAYDRLFAEAVWRGPVLSVAVLALAIPALCRAARVPSLVAAVLAVLAAISTLPWSLGLTPTPMLPGPSAFGLLRELGATSAALIAETPAPVPALPGLVLAVAVAWWLVLHLAHEVTVRTRRPGAALVMLVSLWTVPLAIVSASSIEARTVAPFLAAAIALLLFAGETRVEVRGSRARGVLIGGSAIVIALAAPSVLGGFDDEPWYNLGGTASPRGYQPIVDVSQRLGMPEERDVLRVRSSQRSYLRLAGLDAFDGATWRLGSPDQSGTYRPSPEALYTADGLLPPEVPAGRTQPVLMDVEVLELENIYVPVPYQPVEILGPIRDEMVWSTEGGFLATWETVDVIGDGEPRIGIREGVEYRVQAARPAPDFNELLEVEFDEQTLATHTQLPRDYPELGAQAEEVYAAAGAETVVERALALQDWFVGPEGDFTYDLDVPALRGEAALTDFVLEDRVGYCEYFATAMAVMLRQTGIPARVAVGFLPGRITQEADPASGVELTEYTVSTADAHAWVEVLFPGHGWITFEPTPRDDDSHILPTTDDLAPIENVEERQAREAEEAADEDEADLPDTPDAEVPDVPEPDAGDLGESETDTTGTDDAATLPSWLVVAATLLAVGLVLTLVLVRRRGAPEHRDDDPADAVRRAQRAMLVTAERHGIPRAEHETLPEVLERWSMEQRIGRPDRELVGVTQAAAFGGHVDDDRARWAVEELAAIEEDLRTSVTGRDRAVAPVRRPLRRLGRAAERTRSTLADLRERARH